jgi:hypothetical protein
MSERNYYVVTIERGTMRERRHAFHELGRMVEKIARGSVKDITLLSEPGFIEWEFYAPGLVPDTFQEVSKLFPDLLISLEYSVAVETYFSSGAQGDAIYINGERTYKGGKETIVKRQQVTVMDEEEKFQDLPQSPGLTDGYYRHR